MPQTSTIVHTMPSGKMTTELDPNVHFCEASARAHTHTHTRYVQTIRYCVMEHRSILESVLKLKNALRFFIAEYFKL